MTASLSGTFLKAAFWCCLIAPVLFMPPHTFAAESTKEQYKKIDRDLRQHKKKLEQTKKMETSVLDDLRRAAEELREVEGQHQKQRVRMHAIQGKIAIVQGQIAASSAAIEAQRDHLKKRLRALQKANAQNDALLILLTTEDIGKSMRLMRYLKDISAQDQKVIAQYQSALVSLGKEQEQLKGLRASLQAEERKIAKLEESIKEKQKRREALLSQVRKDKSMYEHLIQSLREDQNRLARILKDAEQKELSRKKSSSGRTGSSKREDVYEDSAFTRLKGKLPWPVQGSVELKYGSQVDPIFNLPVFRSGLTIKAASGASAKAVAEGRVVYADSFKGYGQLVIVSHGGGYHTLYGNLSRIFSHNGAIIKENQPVGEIGESQATGSSGLYFEIRYKGKPLDPQQWLGRR
ncbi:MAG: peptidase M23B [Nitrospirae bacterium]|nr:MAG: peptidase M23B [Nitrospirota bacterium]